MTDNHFSFDLMCGRPSPVSSFIERLEQPSIKYDPASHIKVLIDIPAGFALHYLETSRRADLRLIVITFNFCPEYWEDLWDLRPNVLLVDSTFEYDFAGAVPRVARGEQYRLAPTVETPLSKSERAVLRYVARGWSNKRIAEQLHLQEKTVTNTLTSIYDKLGVQNRIEALLYYWGISTQSYAG